MTELVPSPPSNTSTSVIVWSGVPPLDQHPAVVYLARLGSTQSQRTMCVALNMLASVLGVPTMLDTEGHDVTFLHCNWQRSATNIRSLSALPLCGNMNQPLPTSRLLHSGVCCKKPGAL